MKKAYFSLGAAFAAILLTMSCKDTVPPPDTADQSYYYPVDIGRTYEYVVDSMSWDRDLALYDTVNYLLRENYETVVPNQVGELVTRVRVEVNDSGDWNLRSIDNVQKFYNSSKKFYTIERIINNVSFVMLRIPLANKDTFNRNMKNALLPDYWFVDYIGGSFSVNGKNYSPTLKIFKIDSQDSVYIKSVNEIYAHNVGLVYAEYIDIEGRTDTANWQNIPVMSRIRRGVHYTKILSKYAAN